MNQADGGNILYHFKGDSSDLNKKVTGVSSGFKGMTKSLLVATGVTKAVSAGFNLIRNSMDGAISRYDTLNNFPKVMQNLGISTKDSSKAIQKMSDKLQGLPTTLEDSALAVQRFTSKNNDVAKSTDMFLALNNALLAGGASTELQSSALEQLTQAYSRGKMDMQEWRSLQVAMPAQLNQVAQAMGLTTDQLGEMMREGDNTSATMDEFLGTIIKLNTEGANGFESFDTQAKNAVDGIGTSIEVMHGRVKQGVTAMIQAIDNGMKKNKLGSLSQLFVNIGNTIKSGLIALAPYIVTTIGLLTQYLPPILNVLKQFAPILIPIIAGFKAYQIAVTTITAVSKAWAIVQALLNGVLLLNPIGLIVAGVVALIALIVLLYAKCEWFRNLVNGVFTWIINFFKNNWKNILLFLVNPFAGAFKLLYDNCEGFRNFINGVFSNIVNIVKGAINTVVNVFNSIINFVKNNWQALLLFLVNPFAGAFALLYNNCGAFRNFVNNFVNSVINFFKRLPGNIASVANSVVSTLLSLPGRVVNIGLDIAKGIGRGITNGVGWIKSQIKSMVGDVTSFIKKVFKIGSPSKLMADQVGKWIPRGIAVGINANTDSIYDSVDQMQNALMSGFNLNPALANSLHYSPNVVVNNNVNVETDPLGQTVRNIKTFSGGAKNDYNYGMGV